MSEVAKYCKYCTKRVSTDKKGIICGLTNQKPSFNSSCDFFIKDIDCVEKLGERMTLRSNYSLTLMDKIRSLIHHNIKPNIHKETIIRYSKIKTVFFLSYSFLLVTYIIVYFYQGLEKSYFVMWLPSFAFIAFPVLALAYFRYQKTFSKDPLIKIDKKGLTLIHKLIRWEEFVGYKIYDEVTSYKGIKKRTSYLEIEAIGQSKSEIINVNHLSVSKQNLLELLKAYSDEYLGSRVGKGEFHP